MEVAQIAAWEWHLATGQMTLVDRSRGAVRVSEQGAFGSEHAHRSRSSIPTTAPAIESAIARACARDRAATRPNTALVRPDGSVVWITERGRGRDRRRRRPDGRHQPRRDRRAEAAQERERLLRSERRGARRGRAAEPPEGRVPGHAEPRAAHADERHARLAVDPRERQARSARFTRRWRSSGATRSCRPS